MPAADADSEEKLPPSPAKMVLGVAALPDAWWSGPSTSTDLRITDGRNILQHGTQLIGCRVADRCLAADPSSPDGPVHEQKPDVSV